jgi:hypothetical protein
MKLASKSPTELCSLICTVPPFGGAGPSHTLSDLSVSR